MSKRRSERNKKREETPCQSIAGSSQSRVVDVRQISLEGPSDKDQGRPRAQGVIKPEVVLGLAAEVVSLAAVMPRNIKYSIFKGTGQNFDDWLEEFDTVADANEELVESKAKMFHGMLQKAALKWFKALKAPVHANQAQLRERFVTKFREKGGESKVLQSLSNVRLRRKDSVRKYTQEFWTLISKLKESPTKTMKIEWYVLGVPKDMARHIRHAKVETLNAAIKAAQLFENTESIVENSGNTRTCTTTTGDNSWW
jgi:hypothetical protein